jgi:large subunit ribosomal protein L10
MPLARSKKPQIVEEIKRLIASSRTIGVLDMTKLKAGQAFKIKNAIAADARIKMARKPLLRRALKESGKPDIENVLDKAGGSAMLIFSDSDPFKLYALIKKNRAKAAAKAGDVVSSDVIVPKGPTGLAPGPAITALQKAGLKTRVEAGKIAVAEDKKVLKAGETVTADVAATLQLLGIQPIEVGLSMPAAWEDGMIYGREILDVSPDEYAKQVVAAAQAAMNLSVNIAWPTKDNATLLLQKAFVEARSLATTANVIDAGIIGELLAKAVREAASLEALIPKS